MFNYEEIKKGGKPYVIAEIGANHNGDMDLARKLIKSARDMGAHAAKFQSWNKQSLICKEEYDKNQSYDDSPKKHFGSLEEMVAKYYLRPEQHLELKEYCDEIGIDFCSSPFSPEEVDLLVELDVPFLKVASCDLNNWPFLDYIGRAGKPVIISTGMGELSEISQAVQVLEKAGTKEIIILHCIAIYPPANEDIHLNNIPMLAQAFDYPVGFSDHSIGSAIPLASVALGACVIEKHFTIDKGIEGWDHEISADPKELKEICDGAANIAASMGNFHRTVSDAEKEKLGKFRRSVVAKRAMKAGEVISEQDLTYKRPGTHIPPNEAHFVIGRVVKADLKEDQLISWEDLI